MPGRSARKYDGLKPLPQQGDNPLSRAVKKTRAKPPTAQVQQAAVAKPYERTAKDETSINAYRERRSTRAPFPPLKLKVQANTVANLSSEYGDEEVAEAMQANALGLGDRMEFVSPVKGIVNLTSRNGAVDAVDLNEMLALVVGIGPTNTTEAMLAVQMAAIHSAAMTSALRLRHADTAEGLAIHTKAVNNLTRTFAVQAEALKKLRGTGEQRVVVEHRHYHLAPGSQAVFGDVTAPTGGGVPPKIEEQSHERMLLPERSAVLGPLEADGAPMPSVGTEGQESVPIPRRPGRSALRAV